MTEGLAVQTIDVQESLLDEPGGDTEGGQS
jgi:hypothetical protein